MKPCTCSDPLCPDKAHTEPSSRSPAGSDRYRYCNHHHELTPDHELVDLGDGEFVANKAALPLLMALNEAGIRTRTHHYNGGNHGFVGLLMDNLHIEVRPVHEAAADRDRYNGKMELIISWQNV